MEQLQLDSLIAIIKGGTLDTARLLYSAYRDFCVKLGLTPLAVEELHAPGPADATPAAAETSSAAGAGGAGGGGSGAASSKAISTTRRRVRVVRENSARQPLASVVSAAAAAAAAKMERGLKQSVKNARGVKALMDKKREEERKKEEGERKKEEEEENTASVSHDDSNSDSGSDSDSDAGGNDGALSDANDDTLPLSALLKKRQREYGRANDGEVDDDNMSDVDFDDDDALDGGDYVMGDDGFGKEGDAGGVDDDDDPLLTCERFDEPELVQGPRKRTRFTPFNISTEDFESSHRLDGVKAAPNSKDAELLARQSEAKQVVHRLKKSLELRRPDADRRKIRLARWKKMTKDPPTKKSRVSLENRIARDTAEIKALTEKLDEANAQLEQANNAVTRTEAFVNANNELICAAMELVDEGLLATEGFDGGSRRCPVHNIQVDFFQCTDTYHEPTDCGACTHRWLCNGTMRAPCTDCVAKGLVDALCASCTDVACTQCAEDCTTQRCCHFVCGHCVLVPSDVHNAPEDYAKVFREFKSLIKKCKHCIKKASDIPYDQAVKMLDEFIKKYDEEAKITEISKWAVAFEQLLSAAMHELFFFDLHAFEQTMGHGRAVFCKGHDTPDTVVVGASRVDAMDTRVLHDDVVGAVKNGDIGGEIDTVLALSEAKAAILSFKNRASVLIGMIDRTDEDDEEDGEKKDALARAQYAEARDAIEAYIEKACNSVDKLDKDDSSNQKATRRRAKAMGVQRKPKAPKVAASAGGGGSADGVIDPVYAKFAALCGK